MALLEHFGCFLDVNVIKCLKEKNIKSVTDFLQESPENISKITKLNFKDVLEITQKLLTSFQGNLRNGYNVLNDKTDNYFMLSTGIEHFDNSWNGFQSGTTYEICGLSGSGKTHLCLCLAANTAKNEKCVYYIDTKGDFSATKLKRILSKHHPSEKNLVTCLERIRTTRTFTLYELVSTLHWLKNQLLYDSVPLIIIDCLSTAHFLSVGSDKPIGLGLINHVASLIKYITYEFHTVVVITNLATRNFKNETVIRRNTQPCLGKYWFHVVNRRLLLKKESDTIEISHDGNTTLSEGNTLCKVALTKY